MPPFQEIVDHAKRKKLNSTAQTSKYKIFILVLVAIFACIFLNEMHKNGDYFNLLQVFSFNTNKNEKFIENYFKHL